MRKTIPVSPSFRVDGVTSHSAAGATETPSVNTSHPQKIPHSPIAVKAQSIGLPAKTELPNAGNSLPSVHVVRLDVEIRDKKQLQAMYMPFLVNGGVFIPAVKEYALGETVHLQLHLLKDGEVYQVAGQVVWLTPKHAVYKRMQGIGVHFDGSEEAQRLIQKIGELLQSATQSDKPTHTL